MALTLPDPSRLDAPRLAVVLRDLGLDPDAARAGWLDDVARVCGSVREIPGEPVPTWAARSHLVRHSHGTAPVTSRTLVCSCGGRGCLHVASVLVVLAYNDPERSMALHAPAWEVALAPLAEPAGPGPARHQGHVRYVVHPPTPGRAGLQVEPRIVRQSLDGAGTLQPKAYPRRLADLQAAVMQLAPCDLAIHPAWHALERASRLEGTKNPQATRQLSRALLQPLSQAADVQLDGSAIAVSTSPLRPELVASRTDDGGLALRFEPPLRHHWRDAGVVLTEEGQLQPLVDDLHEAVADRLMDRLPLVPSDDVEAFVDRLVVGRSLAVQLPADLPTVHVADERQARITLEQLAGGRDARGPGLRVRLELVYLRQDAEAVVRPMDPSPMLQVPEAGQVQREWSWEREQVERFQRDVGDSPTHELQLPFERAVPFLADRIPELAETWPVFGRDTLVRLTVRGSLSPSVAFTEGEDWFDLDVGFTLGGRRIEGAAVIRSWLTGSRYHRLDDGSLARLPQRWLREHGTRVDTLAEVRRSQRRLGSWHAWMAAELLEEAGPAARRWLRWVRDAEGRPEQRPVPEGLRATLREYQLDGLAWLRFLRSNRLHGVLADEMGLGKTVQTLAALLDTHDPDVPRPSLVVAPTSVLTNWVAEAQRFTPQLRVCTWHGPRRDPAALQHADLVVTTYALLVRDQATLCDVDWRWTVLDEAQQIKNPGSRRARAARKLKAETRLALTGTPLQNDATELWSLFAYLLPGYLGRRTWFVGRYAHDASPTALAELSHRIRPFLLRRRKAEVAPELPARTEVTLRIGLSQRERALYDSVRMTVLEATRADADDAEHRRPHLMLEGLTRLRQACCHPGLLPFPEARRVRRSSKVEALVEHVQQVMRGGSRCLVFSQWVQLLDRVAERLHDASISCLRLQGDTRDRASVVAAFQAPDGPPVLLISIKAGGTGLNLTAADVVFLLDPWWNPQVEDQATDRAHRIGQTRPVTVVRLVAADTVEERIVELQGHKRRLFEQTVEHQRLDVGRLTAADVRELLADVR
ncbi:MAG: DEAD/DEAH box helicase [Myxococcales bacterium]|nr:DEAD/DEAH box helicase [Myxococcales bacterium]